jgi:aminoglycoside phosphotransferase (APT) family kinase protein
VPPLGGMSQLIQEVAPGGRLVRARRLRGGLGARMHILDLETGAGVRFEVSLRRFGKGHRFSAPEHVALEYRILRLLQEAGVATPRPLHLDREGQLFGMPAIVLSYLAGRPVVSPRNERRWLDGLAGLLHTVHAVTPDRYDLAFSPEGTRGRDWRKLS